MEKDEIEVFSIFGDYSKYLHLTDGKLISGDGCEFEIHRLVLAQKSDYFRTMFCSSNDDRKELAIPLIRGECLCKMLRYIYTGNIYVNSENVSDILQAADYLLITDVFRLIQRNIKEYLTIANCLKIFHVVNEIANKEIAQQAFRFIVTKYEAIISTHMNFIHELSFEKLRRILSSRSLFVYNESSVWQTVVEWIKKDTSTRSCYLPQFLGCLPYNELDANLAYSILNHETVQTIPLMQELMAMKSSKEFQNSMPTLSQLLKACPNAFNDSNGYRAPSHLHLISSCKNKYFKRSMLFITYDENLDIWLELSEADFQPRFIEVVGSHIYFFMSKICLKFDLILRRWLPMEIFRSSIVYYVTHIENFIYIVGYSNKDFNVIEIYDTVNDRWFQLTPLHNIHYLAVATLGKNIYIFGCKIRNGHITMHVFDSVSQKCSPLPLPSDDIINSILVAYRKKLYLIGVTSYETKVEVFEPERNAWHDLPELPYEYISPQAIVINDNFVVYDDYKEYDNIKNIRWNDAEDKWGKLEPTSSLRNFHKYKFAIVDDVNTVRALTKEMRRSETKLKKSSFN